MKIVWKYAKKIKVHFLLIGVLRKYMFCVHLNRKWAHLGRYNLYCEV